MTRSLANVPMREAEYQRIVAGFAELRAYLARNAGIDDAQKRAALSDRLMADARGCHVGDYEAMGFEPMFADPDGQVVVSLPMLLKLGWRIEDFNGQNVLVRPDGRRRDE